MNEVAPQQRKGPLDGFKKDLSEMKQSGDLDMLPANVSYDAFRNAALVAITDNPQILQCSKPSIFKAIRRLAAAGLVPDGREAAIVPFKNEAQAMPMVAGLIKTARNSGEVQTLWADVVYDSEELKVWIEDGERKYDHHFDPLRRTGKVVGAYAVAKLKDGTVEFEPMALEDIEKRRRASANQKSAEPTGVWKDWYAEMAKKTVIRAMCKRLPMSSEDHRRIMVEQDQPMRDVTPEEREAPQQPRPNLAQRLQQPQETPHDEQGEVLPPENDAPPHDSADEPEGDVQGPDDTETQEATFDPFSDEYEEGAKAGRAGAKAGSCPYKEGKQLRDWMAGHKFGREQPQERGQQGGEE